MKERDAAVKLARAVLDRPFADPDDDLALLARQFLRALETPATFTIPAGHKVIGVDHLPHGAVITYVPV